MKTVVKGLSFLGVGVDANCVQVDVEDGRILRIRPFHFDWKYEREPWRIQARGKVFEASGKTLIPPFTLGYKNRIFSPNRVEVPAQARGLGPERGSRLHRRRRAQRSEPGSSGYARITWDEAAEIVAAEILRVKEQYGMAGILAQADGHAETKVVHAAHGCNRALLGLLGGYTLQERNPDSWEGWYWGAKHVWGCEPVGKGAYQSNLIPDIAEHSQMLVYAGCDPETTTWGWGGQTVSRLCYWFSELGIRQVYICPDVNYGAAVHADKWIPILPGTDAALYLAIAHEWLQAGTYDKDYVATHVVGFDKFCAYVLGEADGTPKTPKWAEEKTGVPSRIIKALARAWAAGPTSTVHANGGNMIRGPYATENARLEVCLLGMQGLGKPGRHMLSTIEWGLMGVETPPYPFGVSIPVPRHALYPSVEAANRGFNFQGGKDGMLQFIPKNKLHEAIIEASPEKPMTWRGTTRCRALTDDQFTTHQYPVPGMPEVHMMWCDTPALMTCWNDSNYMAKAFQSHKIECIVTQHPWVENDCEFADLILPVATKFELSDIGVDNLTAEYGTLFLDEKCVEPVGESRSDYEVCCAIAEKLGVLEEFTGGKSIEEWIRVGFDTSGVDHLISWEEFNEKGHFVIPNDPDWQSHEVALRGFADDPDGHPLSTPTGKLEFFSQRLADHFPDDAERPPVPAWVERGVTHDERVGGDRAKLYPYLCLSSHPRWRVHSQHDDMQWLREIQTNKIVGTDGYAYQTAWIHPEDARAKGVQTGDVVRVFNERGAVLVGAYVTERVMPGVVSIDHGARYDAIVPGEFDRGGAINCITPRNTTSKNATGMVTGAFLLDFDKADLDELRREYPEVWARPIDQATGLAWERMLAT